MPLPMCSSRIGDHSPKSLVQAIWYVSEDVLNALRAKRASVSGLGRLSSKAVEVYETVQEDNEAVRQLASGSCNLVYILSKLVEEIPLQDEEKLNRILWGICPGKGPPRRQPRRFFSRRKAPYISEAQLQNYMDQLHRMLFNVQIMELSERINDLEGSTRLARKKPGIYSTSNVIPTVHSSPQTCGDGYVSGASEPSVMFQHNSNNPYISPTQHSLFSPNGMVDPCGVAPTSAVVRPVTTTQRDISLSASHVGGSATTVSIEDRSMKENFNNVTHNVTNLTNIFVPGFSYPHHTGFGEAYTTGDDAYGGMVPMMYTPDIMPKVLADMALTLGAAVEVGIPPQIVLFAETTHWIYIKATDAMARTAEHESQCW
ncbi:hypothetical protein BDP27DRAFT_1418176 [Rhodocollybia butyracea]|uniref:Uncharacterized protein n=1 Tax=Rhodocollybia butyracea TaxID=206335 RepID=A0A9P5PTU7_9AGAR|nr:hypothetical protein BDP27DRAFT_1418176 [Rhodocollybia butyracea]